MLSEISAALATLKTAKDFSKAVLDAKVTTSIREQAIEFQSSIIELQSAIMEMQAKYQLLLDEKNALKKQLIELENWDDESAKYFLAEIAPRVFVYALKTLQGNPAASHWLCPNCYEGKQKSIFQRRLPTPYGTGYACPRCDARISVPDR